jgi:hypothetical protein
MLRDSTDDLGARSIDQAGEFLEMFLHMARIGRSFAGRGYQHDPLDRIADGNQRSNK